MPNRPKSNFYSLRTTVIPNEENKLRETDDEDRWKELYDYRHKAMHCLVPMKHKSKLEAYEIEKLFLNKAKYVHTVEDNCGRLNIEQIAYLLYDRDVIFNLNFQIHFENRHLERKGKSGKGLPEYREHFTEKDWLAYTYARNNISSFCSYFSDALLWFHPKEPELKELKDRCCKVLLNLPHTDNAKEIKGISNRMISCITQETKAYLENGTQSQKDLPHVSATSVHRIFSLIAQAYIAADAHNETANLRCSDYRLLPFIYMVTLLIGSGRLFREDYKLSSFKAFTDKINETASNKNVSVFDKMLESPYFKHPTKAVQQIARAKLLLGLCQILELDEKAQRDNWILFYHLHGKYESFDDALAFFAENEEVFPMSKWAKIYQSASELSDLYDYRLIPLDTLNGFRFGSVLSNGGFDRFLKKYPHVVPKLANRLATSKEDWAECVDKYITIGFNPEHDTDEVCRFIEEVAKGFSLTEIGRKEVQDFFDAENKRYKDAESTLHFSQLFRLLERQKNRSKTQRADILELKCLLCELSMQYCYNHEALKVLKEQLFIMLFGN